MPQWFLRFSEFPEFTEFSESFVPFRENSIILVLSFQIQNSNKSQIRLIHKNLPQNSVEHK